MAPNILNRYTLHQLPLVASLPTQLILFLIRTTTRTVFFDVERARFTHLDASVTLI